MDLNERYNEPGTYVASAFSDLERHTLQAAFTEAVNSSAFDILENAEDGDIADLDPVDDKYLELSLIEDGDTITLTSDEIDSVRSTLIGFAKGTVETIRAKLKETDRHDYYKADGIPYRMRLGRTALLMQQEFASKNSINNVAGKGDSVKSTKPVDEFLASFPELAAQNDKPNS